MPSFVELFFQFQFDLGETEKKPLKCDPLVDEGFISWSKFLSEEHEGGLRPREGAIWDLL